MGDPATGSAEKKIVKTEPAPAGRIVHVCSAAEDRTVLHALVKQLTGVRVTHAGDIRAGGTMDLERRALLDAAEVIVLLISADFVASPEHKTDVVRALEQHAANAAQLVPVLCRPCTWDGLPYAGLLALPRDKQPLVVERKVREDAHEGAPSTVIEQQLREDALAEVAREIRMLVAEPTEIDAACPFPGLEFFDEDRAADFFGREAQITEALEQLAESRPARRWLQIDGPSGAGKSSFARAGIVPAVRAGKLVVGPKTWITVAMRPGYDPITSLAEALVKHAKPPLDLKVSLDAVTKELSSSTTAFKSFLREHAPEGSGVLLVVDQLEETFTLAHADENGVRHFDALLAAALDDREGPLVLVTTIRSDFVARIGELPALEEKLPTQAVRYYLRSMDEAGLRAAIEKPAERAGLAYEDGLVDRIVADASTSRGALPLVAHVLEALYVRRERLRLTARAYDLVGGVGGALAKSADAIIHSLEPEDRATARRLLLRLVKIGRGNEDTRQTAPREVALAAAGCGPEAERVLARLSGGRVVGLGGTNSASGRLVVVSGEAGKERVDLVHEALIQRWGTLRTWIKDAREELELRDDVEEAARIWEASRSSEDGLPRGTALARFRGVDRGALQEGARRYLDAATEAEQHTDQERRAQEEEKRKAEAERTRLRRRVTAGLMGFVTTLVVAAAVLTWQRTKALHESNRADAATHKATQATQDAKREARSAETRRRTSLSADAGLNHFPRRQLLLAVEAWKSAGASDVPLAGAATQALRDAIGSTGGTPIVDHERGVLAAAFSPDDSRIVTVSHKGTVCLWSADGMGKPVVLTGSGGPIISMSLSADGKRIVTASFDNMARVWSPDSLGEPTILRGHMDRLRTVSFDPHGERVVTASDDRTACVWNADGTGTPIVLRGHTDKVLSASFSPNGKRIVTASDDATARVWNADGTGKPVQLLGHDGKVLSAVFSPDGKRIVTASADRTARVWNSDGSDAALVLRGHAGAVRSAGFSPDGKRIVTASDDSTARVWNADGSGMPLILRGHEGLVLSAVFSPDNSHLLTGSQDRTARVWRADGTDEPVILRGHEAEIFGISFSADGSRVITSSLDGTARVWNTHSTSEPFASRGRKPSTYVLGLNVNGKYAIIGSRDSTAQVWGADETGEPVVLRGHQDRVTSASFSTDGQRIVTSSDDGTARLWNAEDGGELVILRGHQKALTRARFSLDGKRIVTGSDDHTARVWNADGTGESIALRGHSCPIVDVAFSLDGKRVVTASCDKTARVWNADGSGKPIVFRHSAGVTTASFSIDGTHIVTGSYDHTVRVWNADGTGEPIALRGGEHVVVSAGFNSDNNRVVAGFYDHTVRVWNADGTGESIAFRVDNDSIATTTFSSDGTQVIATTHSGRVYVWAIEGGILAEMACARAGRNFTRDEWRQFFGDEPYRKTCPQWPEAPLEDTTSPATPTLLPSTDVPVTAAPSLLPSSSSP